MIANKTYQLRVGLYSGLNLYLVLRHDRLLAGSGSHYIVVVIIVRMSGFLLEDLHNQSSIITMASSVVCSISTSTASIGSLLGSFQQCHLYFGFGSLFERHML